jgi:spore coat protein A, manganese oxidase
MTMKTRREFLQVGAAGGTGLYLGARLQSLPRVFAQAPPEPTLPPASITKYVMPLIVPPAMPLTDTIVQRERGPIDYYEIAVRQFAQQILPPNLPMTTVWSYGAAAHPGTFNYPAFTIEARFNRAVRVMWINDLVDANGRFLPHLLPVDPTLHWANPPGGLQERDRRPVFTSTPGAYAGPVPFVTHLHGGSTSEESDGYSEAWYLPAAADIPAGFATVGSWYDAFGAEFAAKTGVVWRPGTATFQYDNDQRASTLWFHDHTLGMTRLNVYAGPAGFYLLRRGPGDLPDAVLPGPAPDANADPSGRFFEIPIAIQDRSFTPGGALFYPATRAFFDEFGGPYIPATDVPPIWNPEFFGNTIVVNGRTWPFLEVEPRRYRFRFLNGCNSRFLILKTAADPLVQRPAPAALPFWQIGAEGGFLPAPVPLAQLLLAPAERADVIVDFTGISVGTDLYLINEGPDEPFGELGEGTAADPATTGQVLKFTVVPSTSRDVSQDPSRLTLPAFPRLGSATTVRRVSLNEQASSVPGFDGPIAALLGTADESGQPAPLSWSDPISETPALGSIEVWEIYNHTEDAHPIHIHEVQFEVLDRSSIDEPAEVRPPDRWETGRKDTVIAYPDEITRVKIQFNHPGLFVWHCHIVEHEDNEMMRPYRVSEP